MRFNLERQSSFTEDQALDLICDGRSFERK